MALEAKFSKEQILELYLNKVYFGGGAYGIDSASRKFFSHSARELSTAEAAIIAGLVKAPSRYSPTADVDAAVGRANVVLEQMRKYGAIGAAEAAAVDVSAVKLRAGGRAELGALLHRLGAAAARPAAAQRQLRADRGVDHARPRACSAPRPRRSRPTRPAARRARWSASTATGRSSRWSAAPTTSSRTTTARPMRVRQPGSAWKLFVYLAALEAGYTPERPGGRRAGDDRRLEPAQLERRATPARSTCAPPSPIRSTPSPRSSATRSASASVAVDGAAVRHHHADHRPIPRWCSAAREVRVIDMTRAFAAVAAGGRSVEPYGITR